MSFDEESIAAGGRGAGEGNSAGEGRGSGQGRSSGQSEEVAVSRLSGEEQLTGVGQAGQGENEGRSSGESNGSGPLAGVKVIEIAGIGPGPFCAMMLADMGADVIRIDRSSAVRDEFSDRPSSVKPSTVSTSSDSPSSDGPSTVKPSPDLLNRGRRSLGVNLKDPAGVEVVLKLAESADILLEGFRPGVAERLGIGPDACLARNPRLVYGRMTGWGQEGPYAHTAGHDINYIALSGVLSTIGKAGEPPVPPVNYLGDFGGGGLLLAFGLVCALEAARRDGKGQVVDAAMVDGSALIATMIYGMHGLGVWGEHGENLLDGGAYYYGVYECADGEFVSIGSLEPQFYAELLELTKVADDGGPPMPLQGDREAWPATRERLEAIFKQKTRDEWCEIMEGTDVCFAPVLDLDEAPKHPHNIARGTFTEVAGMTQPAPAPRFSRTPGSIRRPPPHPGQHTHEVLGEYGFSEGELEELRASGAIK